MLLRKSNQCPYRDRPHSNLAYIEYSNGAWCFGCNKGNIHDRSFAMNVRPPIANSSIILPTGATYDIKEFSSEILAWLYKYYVFDDLIRKYNIMYFPYTYFQTRANQIYEGEGLIFPIISNGEIAAYQQRFFPSKMFYSKNLNKYIFDCGNHGNTLVIVEDYISSIRIGEIENCLWLAGTALTKSLISYIIKNYYNVIVWMDGDKPGQDGAEKIIVTLEKEFNKFLYYNAFSVSGKRTIRNITTELDPKCYSNNEIREILHAD